MIKFENTEVMNFEGAIRGMRNPLNSWDKSDSIVCRPINRINDACPKGCLGCKYYGDYGDPCFCIGENDLKLMKSLVKAGSDHRKFLRQIFVSVDITAPLYWWKEFDTYKVGTVANSCSTMHTIHKGVISVEDFSNEYLCPYGLTVLQTIIENLNELIYLYNHGPEKDKKRYWYSIIQLLPTSYNQKRTVTLNYEVLRNIRHSDRRNHKLDEWRVGFMEWIDSLPYAEELLTT